MASAQTATVVCPFCETLNRVDLARIEQHPKCGKCGKPMLLDFSANWCKPCQAMEKNFWTRPDVIELSGQFGFHGWIGGDDLEGPRGLHVHLHHDFVRPSREDLRRRG